MSQSIDYARHPAYSALYQNSSKYDESRIQGDFEAVEEILAYLIPLHLPPKELARRFRKFCAPFAASLEASTVGRADEELKPVLKEVLAKVFSLTEEYLLYKNKEFSFRPQAMNAVRTKLLTGLLEDGFTYISLSENETRALKMETARLLPFARAHFGAKQDWRGAISLPMHVGFGSQLQDLVKNHKLVELVSEYKKRKVAPIYFGLDYSHERQTWYKGQYSDIGVDQPQGNYFHYDADFDLCKMIIYLTDVGTDNGPFSVAPFTCRIPRSVLKFHAHYAMDVVAANKVSGKERYRNLTRREHRSFFLKFPRYFQGSTHFGDDLLDDSEETKQFLEKSKVVTGRAGTAFIFDGHRTAHRGGMVKSGERLAVQLAFIDVAKQRPITTLKQKLKEHYKYGIKRESLY